MAKSKPVGIHGTDMETGRKQRTENKTKCPLTQEEFAAAAKAITVKIGNGEYLATPKEFKSGSYGFYMNGKVILNVGDTPVEFQVGLNITAIGSKPNGDGEAPSA